ncbi:hypothetical protein JB92DRAFT_2818209 [Gautieria morchelliformis]|nr:hypothetical protein JB92DRAFT_2818209 [Gautieria morchelliformis]
MDLRSNVKHKPVRPPRHENPFDGQPEAIQAAFEAALVQVQTTGFLPEDFGVRSEEWDGAYPDHKALQIGHKGKELVISLPAQIWYPRAVSWAQALYVMSKVQFQLEEQ